jgi:hypothetical protein
MNVIDGYIIDNNTNQITPAKVRYVLGINQAITQTDAAAVFAVELLFLIRLPITFL